MSSALIDVVVGFQSTNTIEEATNFLNDKVKDLNTRDVVGPMFDYYLYNLASEYEKMPTGGNHVLKTILINMHGGLRIEYGPKDIKICLGESVLRTFSDEYLISRYQPLVKAVDRKIWDSDIPF